MLFWGAAAPRFPPKDSWFMSDLGVYSINIGDVILILIFYFPGWRLFPIFRCFVVNH